MNLFIQEGEAILEKVLENEEDVSLVYPSRELVFNAFESTPFDEIKVVIIGQDCYYCPGQAMGLCFSVPPGTKLPPSLLNIYKEIESDTGSPSKTGSTGDFQSWANSGVFMLNCALTVRHKRPGSHMKYWRKFTDNVIRKVSEDGNEGIVFILWGNFAIKKRKLIDETRHYVLTSPHPSPLSAYRGFFGSKPFTKTNELLEAQNKTPIEW